MADQRAQLGSRLTLAPRLWQALVKLSILGNGVLFVLLLGGSHPWESTSAYPQIYPHKPVHFARTFDLLTDARYSTILDEAQQRWDDEVGTEVLSNLGIFDTQQLDTIVIDLIPNALEDVTHNAHNGNSKTFTYQFVCDPANCGVYARVATIPAIIDQTGEAFKVNVYNFVLTSAINDVHLRRSFTHELGHVLSLLDHDNEENPGAYVGIMDGTCDLNACDDFPGDYIIHNYPVSQFPELWNIPDEASCVRLLFDLPGKHGCQEP